MLWVELRTDPNVYHVSVSLYRLTGLNFQLHLKTKSNINTSSKQTKQNINVTIKACWITASDFKSALKGAAEKTVYSAVQSTELLHTASVCSLKAGSWSISILMWVRCCSSNSWLISNFPVTSAKSKVWGCNALLDCILYPLLTPRSPLCVFAQLWLTFWQWRELGIQFVCCSFLCYTTPNSLIWRNIFLS